MKRPLACLLTFVAFALAAHGGEPPLLTDRPDQCDSPFTVSRGLFQIEGGGTYAERDTAGERLTLQSFPAALLRFGLTDGFELRLGVPGISIEQTDSTSGRTRDSGLFDATLGFKVKIAEARSAFPDVAFVGALVVPSGDDGFSSERVDPAFRFAFFNALGERVGLAYNIGMFWLTKRDADDELSTGSFLDWAVTAGYGATDRLGAFFELFGADGVSAEARPLTSAGGGVTYLLTPRLQIDGRLTLGLSQAALDWSVGAGVSYRFPRFER
jgi:hypothetical protein